MPRIAVFAVLLFIASPGCQLDEETGPVAEMERIATKACACRDARCIEGMTNELSVLGKKLSDKAAEVDADDAEKLSEYVQRFAKCAQSAIASGRD